MHQAVAVLKEIGKFVTRKCPILDRSKEAKLLRGAMCDAARLAVYRIYDNDY